MLRYIFGNGSAKPNSEQGGTNVELRRQTLEENIAMAIRRGDGIGALHYSRQLIVQPDATFDDRLQHLSLLEQVHSTEFGGYVTRLQQEASLEAQNVRRLATFLLERNLNSLTHRWLVSLPEDIQSDPAVIMARADVALARHDWPELVRLLNAGGWGESDYVRRAMLARAYRELQEPVASENEWRSAVNVAGEVLEALAALANMAGAWGWQREHDEILWSIVRSFPEETWALETLAHSYTQRADTAGLHLVYATWAHLRPDDLMAKNNLAATSLLLNNRVDRAHELASEIYSRDQENPTYASTYAFSLHLQGRTAEAVSVMTHLPAHLLENSSIAVYYAAMLAAAGAEEMARMYVRRAAQGVLLPEERSMLLATNSALGNGAELKALAG